MQDVMILFGGFLSPTLEVLSKAQVSLMLSGPIYCRRSPIYCFHVSSISSVNCASIGVAEDSKWLTFTEEDSPYACFLQYPI